MVQDPTAEPVAHEALLPADWLQSLGLSNPEVAILRMQAILLGTDPAGVVQRVIRRHIAEGISGLSAGFEVKKPSRPMPLRSALTDDEV